MKRGLFVIPAVTLLIFVNGATDAPNSVAGAVSSGALKFKSACALCAVFNFIGIVLSGAFFPFVTETMSAITHHGGAGSAAAIISVVIFSSAAWIFGIPTSESHGLIAALGGVALYYTGSAGGEFFDITLKSVLSCVAGFLAGAVMLFVLKFALPNCRHIGRKWGRTISVFSASSMSFCHGMQDGQKFIALLPSGDGDRATAGICVICATVMAAGCFCCGKRIINKLGCSLAGEFDELGSAASDVSSLICTAVSSLLGIPVSTTYMKTCSMLGAAVAEGRRVDSRTLSELVLTWILTYPVCMLLSYLACGLIEIFI